MCFPLLPAALAVAGMGANYLGNRAASKATNRANTMERGRQQTLERSQEAALGESEAAARRLRDPAAQGQAVDARRQAFVAALDRGGPSQGILPGAERAPSVVADSARAVDGERRAYGDQQASALAELTAMGDQLLGTQIDMGRAGQRIAQDGASRRRSAAVLDSELQAAATKGSTLRGIGSLLQAASSMAGMGGGGGVAGAAGKVPTPPIKFQGIY